MGLESTPGLSTVLAGDATLEEAVRVVEPFGDNLRVLPGGPPPPNPSELLGSARMAQLFDELVADSDLVIVDTPPLLVVSDSFGLVERASGAIGVARLDQTPKDAARADGGRRRDGAHAAARRGGDRRAPGLGLRLWLRVRLRVDAASAEPAVATDVSGNGHPAPAPEEQRSSGRLAKIFRSG